MLRVRADNKAITIWDKFSEPMATREDRGPSRSRDRADILVSSSALFTSYLVELLE